MHPSTAPTARTRANRRRPAPKWRAAAALAFALAQLAAAGASFAHETIVLPKPKEQPPGEWPNGEVGKHDVVVPVTIEVKPDGTVSGVAVDASIGPGFDAAAIAAASRFTFEPATRNGRPVASRVRAIVRFVGRPSAEAARAVVAPAPPRRPPEPQPPRRPAPAAPPITVNVRGEAPPRSATDVVRGRDAVRAAPRRTASDLLSLVPGVFVTQHGGEGKAHQIFLRGFDAVHGQDVEIWVAGAPVNEVSNVHGQGYADLHFVMPEVVDRIAATPGPFDPRQGDFAVAGSVRYDLGWDEPGFTTKGTLGTYGARRLFLAYRPPGPSDATFAAFETYATDGFGPARAASRSSLVAQALHDFGGGTTGRVMASLYAGRFASAGVLRLEDIDARRVDRFATYDPDQGGSSTRAQLVVDLRRASESGDLALAPFVVLRSLRLRSNFTGWLEDPEGGDSTQQINDAVTVGTTGSYRRRLRLLSDADAIEAGVLARADWIDQSQRRLAAVDDHPTATLVDARVRAVDAAGWLDLALRPVRRVAVRGGLRVDGLFYSAEDRRGDGGPARAAQGAHAGGKGTVDVTIAPGLHALASVGQGFRSPEARSLSDGERTPFTRVVAGEAGLRYVEPRLEARAAAFYTRLGEDLVFDHTTGRNETVPPTARAGFAVDFVAKPVPWFFTASSLTYTRAAFTGTDGRFEEGDLLPYVPQVVVRSDLAFTPTLARIASRPLEGRLGAGFTFLHERPLPFGETGHDVFLVDATAALRLRPVELSVDAFNLLDAGWYDGEFVYPSTFRRGASADLVPARHVTVGAPLGVLASLAVFVP